MGCYDRNILQWDEKGLMGSGENLYSVLISCCKKFIFIMFLFIEALKLWNVVNKINLNNSLCCVVNNKTKVHEVEKLWAKYLLKDERKVLGSMLDELKTLKVVPTSAMSDAGH